MNEQETYSLLQNLTSPVVAITSAHDESSNGMIANSAIRASLVPDCPRVAFYCFKRHYSHELIESSGYFCLHLLHKGQLEVVKQLGFESGRNMDKISEVSHEISNKNLPVLEDVYAYFECRVVNAMDAGASTFYLGDILNQGFHQEKESIQILESDYLRKNLPDNLKTLYKKNKREVQDWAQDRMDIDTGYSWNHPDD